VYHHIVTQCTIEPRMSQTVSKEQVAAHNKSDSLWIVIDEDVYDVTKFQDEHPGK
jgi:cytochrome b involved in lipid metabolism